MGMRELTHDHVIDPCDGEKLSFSIVLKGCGAEPPPPGDKRRKEAKPVTVE